VHLTLWQSAILNTYLSSCANRGNLEMNKEQLVLMSRLGTVTVTPTESQNLVLDPIFSLSQYLQILDFAGVGVLGLKLRESLELCL
jgi:hypothetical protein